jgi:uncharacterized membrane protein YdbT with pleckstrin-like domain
MIELRQHEKVEFIARRHWIVFAGKVLEFVFFILFGIGLYFGTYYYFDLSEELNTVILFILSFYLLIIWQGFFIAMADYYLDTWIATDNRILDIRQKGIFNREISELRYSKIQDITIKTKGFLGTMLDFGDVSIQTAGTSQMFTFLQVPNPAGIKDRILAIHDNHPKEYENDTGIHENTPPTN